LKFSLLIYNNYVLVAAISASKEIAQLNNLNMFDEKPGF